MRVRSAGECMTLKSFISARMGAEIVRVYEGERKTERGRLREERES